MRGGRREQEGRDRGDEDENGAGHRRTVALDTGARSASAGRPRAFAMIRAVLVLSRQAVWPARRDRHVTAGRAAPARHPDRAFPRLHGRPPQGWINDPQRLFHLCQTAPITSSSSTTPHSACHAAI